MTFSMQAQLTLVSNSGGQRSSMDRRQFSYTAHIPERRTPVDRRSADKSNQSSHIRTKPTRPEVDESPNDQSHQKGQPGFESRDRPA